ncbi:MAG: hypothetical protein IT381_16615 [Deltaproteobacteria bacterium]|nr:hypothetical protein [Deltaproteobacteria bacterium]
MVLWLVAFFAADPCDTPVVALVGPAARPLVLDGAITLLVEPDAERAVAALRASCHVRRTAVLFGEDAWLVGAFGEDVANVVLVDPLRSSRVVAPRRAGWTTVLRSARPCRGEPIADALLAASTADAALTVLTLGPAATDTLGCEESVATRRLLGRVIAQLAGAADAVALDVVAEDAASVAHAPRLTQFNLSLLVGIVPFRAGEAAGFMLGVRPELTFLRRSGRSVGFRPYAELSTTVGRDVVAGAGVTLVVPFAEAWAIAPAVGAYVRQTAAADGGVAFGALIGHRRFNPKGRYDSAFGVRVDGRVSFAPAGERALILALSADLAMLGWLSADAYDR